MLEEARERTGSNKELQWITEETLVVMQLWNTSRALIPSRYQGNLMAVCLVDDTQEVIQHLMELIKKV